MDGYIYISLYLSIHTHTFHFLTFTGHYKCSRSVILLNQTKANIRLKHSKFFNLNQSFLLLHVLLSPVPTLFNSDEKT